MQRMKILLSTVALAVAVLPALIAQTGSQSKPAEPPRAAGGPSKEITNYWNMINNRLVVMADDFPEDKYSFKAQKDQRTFAENLIHVAEENYRVMTAIKGAPMGPTGGKEIKPEDYKTKAAVSALMQQMTADGAALLAAQGDAGLNKEVKNPYGNYMYHVSAAWLDAIEHSAEHYGQLVVYYRVSGMVPPASRPKK